MASCKLSIIISLKPGLVSPKNFNVRCMFFSEVHDARIFFCFNLHWRSCKKRMASSEMEIAMNNLSFLDSGIVFPFDETQKNPVRAGSPRWNQSDPVLVV